MRFETTLDDEPSTTTQAPTRTLEVLFTEGQAARHKRVLGTGTLVIGRAVGESGLALSGDPRASRKHAQVELRNGKLLLSNESKRGTFVNGIEMQAGELHDGDVLRIGDSFLLVRECADDAQDDAPLEGLLGKAPAMRALRRSLRLVGRSEGTVLLLGESGTGKELAAKAVHAQSKRTGAFVAVNCAAIPESLAESQLFGHVAGSYTGAKRDSPGYFQAADGGTLFLDEIGELSSSLQPKLLRALEEHTVTPIGTTRSVPCNVRVVAATNRNLLSEVQAGQFRGDLYARLAGLTVELPPLRARREDILLLLERAASDVPLEPALVAALLAYDWPFNVRELLQLAAHCKALISADEPVNLAALAARLEPTPRGVTEEQTKEASQADESSSLKRGPAPDEGALRELLLKHGGMIAAVARETGRSRKQVYRWLEEHGLDAEQYREQPSKP